MTNSFHKLGWVLAALVSVAALAALTNLVAAGPLDPPGPPTTGTMKTLDDIPGSWSRNLPANDGAPGPNPPAGCNSSRFKCVLNDEAVLDLNTGLVWERSINQIDPWAWTFPLCFGRQTGNVKGWRLPTMEELASVLTDDATALPTGHPFTGLLANQNFYYWTATTDAGNSAQAWAAQYFGGIFNTWLYVQLPKNSPNGLFWCVRGGHGYDAY